MNPVNYLFILCVALLVGCSNNNSQHSFQIQNKELSNSYKNFDKAFKESRNKIFFSGNRVASDCKVYFDLTSKYELDESIYNQLVKSEYLTCDALNILSNSSVVLEGNLSTSKMGEDLLSKLDLRSFPSSLSQVSDDRLYTLKSLYPDQVSSIGNVAELNTEDWVFTLEVVAVANIDGNSNPDWIVWLSDESKSGNYRGYSTLIIYDTEQKSVFKAITYP